MLATLVAEPFEQSGWVYEENTTATASWPQGKKVTPFPQREGPDAGFSEVAEDPGVAVETLLLDGEVVASTRARLTV
jgi:hypothetical protein